MISNHSDRAKNNAVLASLPVDPEVGSYYWIAKKARQYTGASMLDSGSAYGRHHSSQVPSPEFDISISFYNGRIENASINTIKWMESLLEFDDETAALQEVYDYLLDMDCHSSHWELTPKFPEFLEECKEVVPNIDDFWQDDEGYDKACQGMNTRIKALVKRWYVPPRMGWNETTDQHDANMEAERLALAAKFPRKAIECMYESMSLRGGIALAGRDNVYNSDNDFDQNWIFQWLNCEEGTDSEFLFIEFHGGCDVRGGYGKPLFARAADPDYFYNWTVDVWADPNQWDTVYDYCKALEGGDKWRKGMAMPDHDDIIALLLWDKFREIPMLPGIEGYDIPATFAPHEDDEDVLQAIVRHVRHVMEENPDMEITDFEIDQLFPLAMIATDDGLIVPDAESGFTDAPAHNVLAWNGVDFRTGFYNPVSGW